MKRQVCKLKRIVQINYERMSNKPGQQYTNGSMNQKQIDPVAPDKNQTNRVEMLWKELSNLWNLRSRKKNKNTKAIFKMRVLRNTKRAIILQKWA